MIIEWFSDQIINNQFFSGAVAAAALVAARDIPGRVANRIKAWATVELNITDDFDYYEVFETWVLGLDTFKNSKRLAIADRPYNSGKKASQDKFSFRPAPGLFWGFYKGRILFLNVRCEKTENGRWARSLTVSTFGKNASLILSLVADFSEANPMIFKKNILQMKVGNVYGEWDNVESFARSWDSIYLDDGLKESIRDDLHRFEREREFLAGRGIPAKRCYMVHGEPGTGKSTLARVLATDLLRPLYYVDLGESDKTFLTRWKSIEDESVIVIEDIDAQRGSVSRDDKGDSTRVSLSTLLNCLDGAFAKNGAVIIITTNRPEELDDAIKRAGRVDREFYFGRIGKDAATKMCIDFLGPKGEQFAEAIETPISPAVLQEKLMQARSGNDV